MSSTTINNPEPSAGRTPAFQAGYVGSIPITRFFVFIINYGL